MFPSSLHHDPVAGHVVRSRCQFSEPQLDDPITHTPNTFLNRPCAIHRRPKKQVRGSPPSLAVLASKVLLEESGLNTNLELKFKNKVPDEVIEGVKHMNEYAECM